jgi:HSP20 family protein
MSNLARRLAESPFNVFRDDLFFPLEQGFDDFFNGFFGNSVLDGVKSGTGYPKLDATIEGEQFVVRAAIPGVKPDDVVVDVLKDVVRVSGCMSGEYKKEDASYYVRELHKSKFMREFRLPEDVVGDPIAEIKDGILTLKWKYDAPVVEKPKRIEVNKKT